MKFEVEIVRNLSTKIQVDAETPEQARLIALNKVSDGSVSFDDAYETHDFYAWELPMKTTYVVLYKEKASDEKPQCEILYGTYEEANYYLDKLSLIRGYEEVFDPFVAPEEIVMVEVNGDETKFSLCPYDNALQLSPDWAFNHQYLWKK